MFRIVCSLQPRRAGETPGTFALFHSLLLPPGSAFAAAKQLIAKLTTETVLLGAMLVIQLYQRLTLSRIVGAMVTAP